MSILVTGAAGFIGSHLTERLLEAGEEVVGLDSFDDFYDPRLKEHNLSRAQAFDTFTLVRGDIRDAAVLTRLPADIDTIIHLAARAGVRPSIARPALYYDVNVSGTLQLLELAKERGLRRFIFASSSSVYGNNKEVPFSEEHRVDHPISPYAATKKACELLCHTYHHLHGLSCICLRFFTVYGARQRPDLAIHKFARLMRAGEEIPVFGDGCSRRDYTYIEDILGGLDGALRWVREAGEGFEIVNLGESRTVELREMVRVVAEELGVEPRLRWLPAQPGDVHQTYADISKARRLLGYDPHWELREGVRAFVKWLDEQTA